VGKLLEEAPGGTSFGLNFAQQFVGGALQVPDKLVVGLFNLVTPSGLSSLVDGVPDETVESPTRQKQLAIFQEAANPENSYLRRGASAAAGVLSQPVVIVEEALIIPVLEVPVLSGNVGRELSKAIDTDNDVDRAVHLATATRDFATAFGILGGLATGVQQGIARTSVGKVTQFKNVTPDTGGSFFDIPGPAPRGVAIEGALAKSAPASVATPRSYPVVDRVDPGGVVTSVKSVDLTLPSAQNVSALRNKVRGFVDKVDEFQGATREGFTIRPEDIQGRAVEVVVQKGKASAQQITALQEAVEFGAQKGVKVKIVEIP
jgi:hypothetical protein